VVAGASSWFVARYRSIARSLDRSSIAASSATAIFLAGRQIELLDLGEDLGENGGSTIDAR
jgi:hypothetical protein